MTCVWDSANKSANITLYRSDTCAAGIVSNGSWKSVRGTISQSTGKKYLEMTQGYIGNSGMTYGFGNSSLSTASYVGADTNSFGYQANLGLCQQLAGTWQSTTKMGEVVQFAIDLDAKLVWARTDRSTNWNNSGTANPATGVGGKTYTTTGALFPMVGLLGSSSVATTMNWAVLNAGGFTFTGTVPSGFSAWDSGTPSGSGRTGGAPTVWDTGAKNANITLTGPNLQASQASAASTWAAVYTNSKYNSGLAYFEVTMLSYDNGTGISFGLSDATAGTANGTLISTGSFGVGYQVGANVILWSASGSTGEPTWQGGIVPNTFGCAVDFGRGLMWVKNLNAAPGFWNNDSVGDPVAGLRGAAIPPGDLYIGFSGFFANTTADTIVLNTGASTFVGSAPSGYSAWDSSGAAGATAQITTLLREVLLVDTGVVAATSVIREVLLTDTPTLQINDLIAEALTINPAALQVGNVFAEVLRSTTIWTPTSAPVRNRTYKIR